jgi:hypothetical protein
LAEAVDNDLETLDAVIRSRPYAKVRGASPQTIIAGPNEPVRFDIEDFDTDDMVDLSVDRYHITIQTSGFYWVWARVRMDAQTPTPNTVTVLVITKNGITSTVSREHTQPVSPTFVDLTFGSCAHFTTGDLIGLTLLHGGATIDVSRFRELAAFKVAT